MQVDSKCQGGQSEKEKLERNFKKDISKWTFKKHTLTEIRLEHTVKT